MEDLKKWIGQDFLDFCRADPDDERRIAYTLHEEGKETRKFTSDDIVSPETIRKIRKSTIVGVGLTDNCWHIKLKYKERSEMEEIKMSKLGCLEAEKEEYKQMYAECFPHLAIVADILAKFRSNGVICTDDISVYITPDGYISMGSIGEGWKLSRLNRDAKPEITCEVREEI